LASPTPSFAPSLAFDRSQAFTQSIDHAMSETMTSKPEGAISSVPAYAMWLGVVLGVLLPLALACLCFIFGILRRRHSTEAKNDSFASAHELDTTVLGDDMFAMDHCYENPLDAISEPSSMSGFDEDENCEQEFQSQDSFVQGFEAGDSYSGFGLSNDDFDDEYGDYR
jgi:hypothetical protein